MNRQDALKQAEEPIDFTAPGTTVEREPRQVKMTYSFRLREQDDEPLARWLVEEADRRNLPPGSDLLRELLNELRLGSIGDDDQVVTVRLSVLRRGLGRVVEEIIDHPAAA